MLDALPGVLGASAEPFADSSAIPTFLVARETRRHVKVALSGDGGDELFGGYRSYLAEDWRARYHGVPALAAGVGHRARDRRAARFARDPRRGDSAPGQEVHPRREGAFRRAAARAQGNHPRGCPRQAREGRRQEADPALAWVRQLLGRCAGDAVNRMLATDVIDSLPGDMLTKVDLMSMANSLEVRVPLLDHRVVELAFPDPRRREAARGRHQARAQGDVRAPAAAGSHPAAESRVRDPDQPLAPDGPRLSGRPLPV